MMIMGKYKAHTIYRNKDGKRIPGVTTITGELGWSKQYLINWANRIGLEGIDANKYRDDKADIGTLAHLMITNGLQGKKTSTADYSENQIKAAKQSVKSFKAWAKDKEIEPILIEEQMVSEQYQFGGTCDIFAKVNGVMELIDLKTGKGIYDEHFIQVGGGYNILLNEHGYTPEHIWILNIPRSKGEQFEDKEIRNPDCCKEIFLKCLDIYRLKKSIYDDSFYSYVEEVSD
jgi:hypothetical protein